MTTLIPVNCEMHHYLKPMAERLPIDQRKSNETGTLQFTLTSDLFNTLKQIQTT